MLQVECVLAYLDPGTGSLIAQFLIAGIISATAVFSGSLARVKRFFSGSSTTSASGPVLLPFNPADSTASDQSQQRRVA